MGIMTLGCWEQMSKSSDVIKDKKSKKLWTLTQEMTIGFLFLDNVDLFNHYHTQAVIILKMTKEYFFKPKSWSFLESSQGHFIPKPNLTIAV